MSFVHCSTNVPNDTQLVCHFYIMDILSIKKHTVSSLLFDIIERIIFFMNVISWTRQFSWFDHFIDLLKHKDEEIIYKKYGMMNYRHKSSFTMHIMKTSTCAELMWDFFNALAWRVGLTSDICILSNITLFIGTIIFKINVA